MNNIYVGAFLSLFCVCLSYYLLPTFVLVTVSSLVLACAIAYLKDDFLLYQHVGTHVAWFYHKTSEIYRNIENMFSKSDSTNISLREQSQNNGTITSNLDKISLGYRSGSHNLGSPQLLKSSPSNSNSWISSNKINLRQSYHTSTSQNSVVNFTPPSNSCKIKNIESSRQYANSSLCVGSPTSSQSPRNYCSLISQNNNSSSENTPRICNKSAKGLDARLYANVNSPGFCSRVAEHLNETMTHQPKYDTVGAFPVVHLKSNPSKIKIKTPVRVRLTPRTNDLSYSSVGTNSMTRSPLTGADESMKSVLQVLKEISRKRIHSNVEEDSEDTTKRLRVNEVQYNSDGVLHATLLQQTIQGKRAREETSPIEDDVKKRRKPLKNNEITSSLSSSLSIKPPHLKTTKRKAPDIDDSISTTPTIGKQLKIQTEVTPPLPTAPVIYSEYVPNQEYEVQTASADSPRSSGPVVDASTVKTQSIIEEPKIPLSEAITSLPENDDDKVVSRLLGRMSSPMDDTSALEVPVKKNVFMSTNDLSLSPPKENRLAAMIAVLGGPSENLDGVFTDSEVLKQPETNLAAKALFTSPETPKQHKKVTFANTLTETKVYDTEKCASNETVIKEQTPVTSKPLSINFGLSPFSPSTTETVKQSLDSKSTSPSISPIVTPSKPTTSSSNSSPNLTFLSNVSHSENSKAPPTFSFGATSSPGQINKEKTPPPFPSVTKPITFSSEPKNPAPTESTAFGSQSVFVKTTVENESKTAAPVLNKTAQQFNLFSNENMLTKSSEVNKASKGVKNNQLVNGFSQNTVTKSTSPFSFSASVSQASSSKPLFPSLNQQLNGPSQSTTINFGSPSSVALASSIPETAVRTVNSQPVQNMFASSANQPSQSNNTFSSVQSSPFSKAANQTPQDSTVLKTGTGQIGNLFVTKTTNDQNSGSSQPTLFANNAFVTLGKDSKDLQNSTVQTRNLFGNSSSNSTPKLNLGTGPSPSQNSLGFSANTTPTTLANVGPFGVSSNNTATQPSSLLGSLSSTTQSSTIFGSATLSANSSTQMGSLFSTSTANTTQPSMFSSSAGAQSSKSIFSSSTTTPSFGIQNKTSAPAFGNSSNNTNTENPSNFGSQTTNSSFGTQNNTNVFNFGNTNTSNVTQSGFGSSGSFNLSTTTSSSSSIEVKPPAFNSSTFMFGSTTTTANKDVGKPFATPPQFSFGGNSQQTNQSMANSAQPSLPTFGTSSTGFGSGQQIPSFIAGISQPSTPAFSSSLSQSTAPSFTAGVSQTAGSVFSAGVSQSAPSAFSTGISQPSTPAFGAGISQPAAPAFGAGISQPAAPTFGAGISQSSAPAFSAGLPQPSTGGFTFGQQTSAGPTFQFNATAPQPVQGGMFSIGSGGSSAPRSKTGALRRRYKMT